MTDSLLPSDEWTVAPLHWHAHSRPATRDLAPEMALHDPAGVATWLAERSAAHLWQSHYLIASRGESVRHNHLMALAVLNEVCPHGCVTAAVAPGQRP